ncbi:MAG: TetR/AcrR family transcriptional regulator [Ktedonobacterales bacterium]
MAEERDVGEQARSIELLWGEKGEPSRGPKPGLSVRQIVQAAIEIANAEGLEAVSMQRVARACGVTTMALYRYVPGKADLVALMIDMGIGEPPALDKVAGGWRPQLEEWARLIWAAFHRGPWSLEVTASARLMGPNELGWFEAAVGALSGTGLSGAEAVDAVLVVLNHVRSMAQYSLERARRQRGSSGERWGTMLAGVLRKHGDRFPALTAAMAAGALSPSESDALEYGLGLVLDGIAMRIAEHQGDHRWDQ